MNFEFELAEPRRRKRRTGARESRRTRLLGMVQRRIRFQQFDRELAPLSEQLVDQRREFWKDCIGPLG